MGDVVPTVVDLHARYGNVLKFCWTDLEGPGRGQSVAMLGANGVGKTTVLRAISGSLLLDAGTVRLLDEDITTHQLSCDILAWLMFVKGFVVRQDLPEGRRAWVIRVIWRTRCSLSSRPSVIIPTPSVRQHDVPANENLELITRRTPRG